jgi:hypothetical protein
LQLTTQPQQKRKIENMTTLQLRNSVNRSPLRRCFFLIPLVLACFALPRVVVAADGGLAGGNTAEGDNALNSLTSGTANTAMGNSALLSDTRGFANTALGFEALQSNVTGFNNTNWLKFFWRKRSS